MKCPVCKSADTNGEDHPAGFTFWLCVECEAAWLATDNKIDAGSVANGAERRAMRREIENAEFTKEFNEL